MKLWMRFLKGGQSFRKKNKLKKILKGECGIILHKNMKILEYLVPERVNLDLKGTTKAETINEMAQLFVESGIIDSEDLEEFVREINEREQLTPTGMQDGIAIPHARTPLVKSLSLAMGISHEGVDFESMDGEPSKLIFMIAAPEGTKKEHLDLLAEISKLSFEEELVEQLEEVKTVEGIFEKLKNI